jgi:hypothetical protein
MEKLGAWNNQRIYDDLAQIVMGEWDHEVEGRAIAWLKIVVAIKPDWDEAPDWAQWWAVDDDGAAYWYELRPEVEGLAWGCRSDVGCAPANVDYSQPLGYDRRASLRQRPAVQP